MEEIKVSEMLQADSIEKDNAVMIIQDGVNKKASGSIQTVTGTSLSLTSVADTCKVKSNSKNMLDSSTFIIGDYATASATIRTITSQTLYLRAGTYTISTNLDLNTYRYYVLTTNTPIRTAGITQIYNSSWQTSATFTFTINSSQEGYFSFTTGKINDSTITSQEMASYNFQLEEGSTATEYNPYNTEVLFAKNENEFDKNLVTDNSYFSTATGIISSAPSWMITDYIEIADDKKIRIDGNNSTTTGSGVYGIYYDINKTIVGSIAYVDYKTNKTIITAPHNAKFVKFSFNNGQKDTLIIQSGETLYLTPDEAKTAFTYDTETIVEANGSVTIEYNTQSRLLNNDDVLDIVEPVKEYVDEKIEKVTTYSTDEVVVGKWINGKSLYRKVIEYTIPSGTTSIGISLGIANIKLVQKMEIRCNAVGTGDYEFGSYYSSSSDYKRFFMRSNELQVRLSANTSGMNIVAIVEYTKTTDA